MITQAMLIAAFGGFAVEFVGLMNLKNVARAERPDFRDVLYWLPFIGLPLLGAVLAFIYERSDIELTSIIAFNVGASAPLIVRSLSTALPLQNRPDPPPGA